MRSDAEREIEELRKALAETQRRLSASEEKLGETEGKLCVTEEKLGETEEKLNVSEEKLCAAEKKLGKTEGKLCVTEEKLGETERELHNMTLECEDLRRQLARRYRKTSEVICEEQLQLFNEAELEALNIAANAAAEDKNAPPVNNVKVVRGYVQRKAGNKILQLPANTPITVEHVESKPGKCSLCGKEMVKTGERCQDTIVKTTEYSIARKIYDVYGCMNCTGEEPKAALDEGNVLNGTICDPLMLGYIINSKFNLGVPLYRQERMMKDDGIPVSRQTMASWMMKAGWRIIDNLEPVLEQELFKLPMINADETPTLVLSLLDEDGKKKAPNSKYNAYMLGRIGVDSHGKANLVSFRFTDNRRNQTLADYFGNYHGVLQSDGLAGYAYTEKVHGLTHLGCLVHARRKAVEACGGSTMGIASDMVGKYAGIFHVEATWNSKRGTMPDSEFVEGRKAEMLPMFEDFRKWLLGKVASISSEGASLSPRTRTAVDYYIRNYDSLIRFLDYPFATSSNQLAEQSIRKYVIDRNSYLFNITEKGADVSALFFSLVLSCRNLGINPVDYLAHLFSHAGSVRNGDVEGWTALLPGRCDTSDITELRKKIACAAPDPERTEPYILRGKRP